MMVEVGLSLARTGRPLFARTGNAKVEAGMMVEVGLSLARTGRPLVSTYR